MKKYNCLLLVFIIACCGAARAQTPTDTQGPPVKPLHPAPAQSRWSLDILGGPAIPVGQYARSVPADAIIVPVKTGGFLELSGSYHVNRSFGIVVVASGQRNQTKDGSTEAAIFGAHPTNSYSGANYLPMPYDNSWKIARLMTGGEYTLALNKSRKFDLVARILGGLQKSKTAGFVEGNGGSQETNTPLFATTLPWAFTYQGDIGFKWKPKGRLALIAYAGYNGCMTRYSFSYMEYVQTPVTTTLGPTIITVEQRSTLPTSSLLLRAGIEWGF